MTSFQVRDFFRTFNEDMIGTWSPNQTFQGRPSLKRKGAPGDQYTDDR